MRALLRNIILSGLGTFKTPAPNITLLNGHFVQRNSDSNDASVFAALLKQLKKKVDFVNVEEAIERIAHHEKVKKPLVAFTFDDGFTECYDSIAPVLTDYGVNALFFVNPGYIEGDEKYTAHFNNEIVMTPGKKPMSYSQIKELSDNGFLIGNHTTNHIRLSDFDDIESEIVDAKRKIEKAIERECKYFAWTYGQAQDITPAQIEFILQHHEYLFSGTQFNRYFFNGHKKVLNRRHFEGNWPVSHLNYFLSRLKEY